MDEYSSSGAECLVGIVHVDISSLVFQDEIEARQIDDTKVQKLINIFTTSSHGCERDEPENHIPAVISSRELSYILQISQLTRDDLQRSLLGRGYPKLNTLNNKIYCLHGRHRLRAAAAFLRNFESDNYWWTIKLYTFEPENHHRGAFLRKKAEQFSHQAKFSDGEVYRKIRYYQRQSREDLVQDWRIRLTDCKQICLSRMLKDENLVKAFDMLLAFPGLWSGLELGNIKKHLALHCDEEILHYLKHIYNTWNEITLGNLAIQQAVDIQTVQSLQSRAPSISVIDRHYIIRKMDSRALFSTIVDGHLRELIKQTLLRLQVIIPTIKSFHENLKYFGIGAKILKTHLLSGPIETTMYRTLCSQDSQWSPPENIMVEFREGEFQHALLPEGELPVRFAYKQVFISALRQFPSLSEYGPRQERRQEAIRGTIDPAYSLLFLARAQLLGFRTEKILRGLENAPEAVATPYVEPVSGLTSDGEIVKRRLGRPFSNAYKQFRTQLFLPNLFWARAEVSLNPSVLFVQQDFFNAFFGSASEIMATSMITVSTPLTMRPPAATREATPPPGLVSSAQIPHEIVVTPEPAPSRAEVLLAPEAQHYGAPREPSVSEALVSPEPVASPEQVASETSISPGIGEPSDQFSRTSMELEHEEAQSQSNTIETTEQRRSFIDVNSTTSEVSEGTTQNGRSVSETGTLVGELVNNTEIQVISRVSPEIGTLEARRSFIMPDSLNSPISAISATGTEEGHSFEFQSPPSAIVSQRPRSFLSPGPSPISQGYRSSEAWNSLDRRSFLTPRPLSSPTSVAGAEDYEPPEIQSLPAEALQSHRSFLAPEAAPVSAAMSQSRRSFLAPEAGPASAMSQSRSFLALEAGPASAAMSQSHRSFLMPESGSPPGTEISQGHRLSESPIPQAGNSQDRRSFLTLESRLADQTTPSVPSFLALEVGPASAAMSQSRRSFLMPECGSPPGTEISQGHRLSESPIPQAGNSQDRRSFLTLESPLADQTTPSVSLSHRFKFIEYNGMRTLVKLVKSTQDMNQYLQQRESWIGMVIRQRIAKTIRFDHIVKHMINNDPSQDEVYALVKVPYADQFRRNLLKVTRSAEDNEDGLDFASSSSNKRPKQ